MDALLTWILAALVFGYLIWGLRRPETIYEFPFMAAVMTVSFLLPQLPAMVDDRFLPVGGYARMVAFTILCIVALGIGWQLPARAVRFLQASFEEQRLLWLALGFSLIGAFFYAQVNSLPGDVSVGVPISGAQVAYLFFARFLTYGLTIAVLCFMRRPSWFAGLIIGFGLIFYLDRILITGKRAETIELVMIFVLAAWFQRRWAVPRLATISAIAFGTVAMISMTQYRDVTRANSGPVWDQIAQIDLIGNFEVLLAQGGPEAHNAVLRIDHIEQTKQFDFGAFHWDNLVSNFVPSQWLGMGLKQSLLLPLPPLDPTYEPATGSTETGMTDAFQSFWWFGALKFLLLAYLMRRLWNTAMGGYAAAQIVFILSIVPAMHSISHLTDWVLTVWVHMALFLAPALYLVSMRTSPITARRGISAGHLLDTA